MTNIIMKIKIIDAKIMLDVRMKVMVNFVMMNVTIYSSITKKLCIESSRILTENSVTLVSVNVCKYFALSKELQCEISCFLHVVVEAFYLLGCYTVHVSSFVHEHQHTYATYHLRRTKVSKI